MIPILIQNAQGVILQVLGEFFFNTYCLTGMQADHQNLVSLKEMISRNFFG
jgi:hypothetical protein